VRRRLAATKDLAEQMMSHPFFATFDEDTRASALTKYLVRKLKVIDDQTRRCNELADQTTLLISLIFNIATLQDAKAAVEETKAANTLASSIRRVTMLTLYTSR
jgi:putative lipase involved disintegration of autophagic bodies